jgi:hypothetical protein
MLTKQEIEKEGYRVLPKGGWVRLDPTIIPMDWYDICNDFDIDPECEEVILCICGVKEIHEGEDE